MTLHDIVAGLESLAQQAWDKIKAEAITIEQKVEPVVESGLAVAFQHFGHLAVETVTELMTAAGANLSGGEKLNLTVTKIVDAAEQKGIAIAHADATALAKNAYAAVMGKAPAAGETLVEQAVEVAEKAASDAAQP